MLRRSTLTVSVAAWYSAGTRQPLRDQLSRYLFVAGHVVGLPGIGRVHTLFAPQAFIRGEQRMCDLHST